VRFERLVADGRAALEGGAADAAVRLLDDALGLWRGDPLPELEDTEAGAQAARRWADARLAALEDRADAELRRGRHAAALTALEDLTRRHPLRERATGLLLLALYRAGRQADAVEAYQRAAALLRDELGLDPGPELRARYEEVLRQDPALGPSSAAPVTVAATPAVRASRLPRQVTAFVGRPVDPERIVALLDASGLVTLTGPGGVGKTRLAVEAARLVEGSADDVRYVTLAEVAEPADVPLRLARELGVVDEASGSAGGAADVTAVLREALRDRGGHRLTTPPDEPGRLRRDCSWRSGRRMRRRMSCSYSSNSDRSRVGSPSTTSRSAHAPGRMTPSGASRTGRGRRPGASGRRRA
jgi:hypothetical protein